MKFLHSVLRNKAGDGSSGGGSPAPAAPATTPGTMLAGSPATAAATPPAPAVAVGELIIDGKFADGFSQRLPDDLKPYGATLRKFEKVPLNDVLKSYGELEKKIGQRVQPPAPDAKPEEVAAWRKITGAPDKPEDYKITRPDDIPAELWSDDLASGFAAIAHKHHLPPSAVAEIAGWWNGQQKDSLAKLQASQQSAEAETATALQTEWGEKMADNIRSAQRVAAVAKLDINDPAIGNNPAVIRALHAMSALISDDKQVTGANGGPSLSTRQQADDIQTNPANPYHADYHGKNGPERQAQAADRVRKLRVAG